MAKTKEPRRPDPEKMTFEEATEELEAIIERIEEGEIGLEESLGERRRGEALIKRCRSILDTAEQELEQVTAGDQPESTAETETETEQEHRPDPGR